MMALRARYVPEEQRSTIINIFRIPLNAFVCIILYKVSDFPLGVIFALCCAFLVAAGLAQAHLAAITAGGPVPRVGSPRDPKGPDTPRGGGKEGVLGSAPGKGAVKARADVVVASKTGGATVLRTGRVVEAAPGDGLTTQQRQEQQQQQQQAPQHVGISIGAAAHTQAPQQWWRGLFGAG
jgi:hypothetical protein